MTDDVAYLTPEAKARVEIDRMLRAAGWAVQSAAKVNLRESLGVAVREFVLKKPHGRVDYLLFVDGRAVGVVEAKKEGEALIGVEWQSARYVEGLPDDMPRAVEGALPFLATYVHLLADDLPSADFFDRVVGVEASPQQPNVARVIQTV
jgi:type I restriction enzyme, R subunit